MKVGPASATGSAAAPARSRQARPVSPSLRSPASSDRAAAGQRLEDCAGVPRPLVGVEAAGARDATTSGCVTGGRRRRSTAYPRVALQRRRPAAGRGATRGTSTRSEVKTVVPPLPRCRPDQHSPHSRGEARTTRRPENSRRGTSCRQSTSGSMARTTRAAASAVAGEVLDVVGRHPHGAHAPVGARASPVRRRRARSAAPISPASLPSCGGDDPRLRPVAAAGEVARGTRRAPARAAGRRPR